MAGAGRDLTTTVVTAPTGIILATAIGVIITTTATTTINNNGSGAYELRYPLTDK
jgi:aromatic ring-opening dioxygenase LigB subunit